MTIPEWDSNKVLPPIHPNTPEGQEHESLYRAPYVARLEEFVTRFATTPQRVEMMRKFLDYRAALHLADYMPTSIERLVWPELRAFRPDLRRQPAGLRTGTALRALLRLTEFRRRRGPRHPFFSSRRCSVGAPPCASRRMSHSGSVRVSRSPCSLCIDLTLCASRVALSRTLPEFSFLRGVVPEGVRHPCGRCAWMLGSLASPFDMEPVGRAADRWPLERPAPQAPGSAFLLTAWLRRVVCCRPPCAGLCVARRTAGSESALLSLARGSAGRGRGIWRPRVSS